MAEPGTRGHFAARSIEGGQAEPYHTKHRGTTKREHYILDAEDPLLPVREGSTVVLTSEHRRSDLGFEQRPFSKASVAQQGHTTHIFCHVGGKGETHPKVLDPVAALRPREVEAGAEDEHEDDVGDA